MKAKILDKPEIEPVPGKVRSIVGESTCFSFTDFFQYPVSQRSVKFHNHFDYLCFFDSIQALDNTPEIEPVPEEVHSIVGESTCFMSLIHFQNLAYHKPKVPDDKAEMNAEVRPISW